jgi:hypothetical protein
VVRYTLYMGEKNMNKKPITIYWSPYTSIDLDGSDWSFLYPKPKILFSDLLENKSKQADNKTYLSCPAVANKFKKMFTFYSPMSCSYKYDFLSNPKTLEQLTDNYISVNPPRQPAISNGPSLEFSLKYIMFADSPVNAYFTPPMFHEPRYMKYGSVIPGEFDIGNWFRPYNFELQTWSQSGEIHIQENEPLFYAEIKTDRPIILKQFELSNRLVGYAKATVGTTELFGRGQSLASRYSKFRNIGMREKILTEIKKNLID